MSNRDCIGDVSNTSESMASIPVDRPPFVSILIPCRNEEKHIGECLTSVLANDYPVERLEILVLDGLSSDHTRPIVEEYAQKYPVVKLITNPDRTIPAAMNVGIRHARGQIVVKLDAHSTYPTNYVSQCVRFLIQYGADNVGGILNILPGASTTVARAIALALSHRFGSGTAYIKIGARGPRWADSVAFGCFRREVFEKVGPWNEQLSGSSDMDFNVRLKKAGGKILLVPSIETNYYADSDLHSFGRHVFADGVWATYVLKFGSRAWAWRHWVPLAFVLSLLSTAALKTLLPILGLVFFCIVGTYAFANLLVSICLSIREKNPRLLFPLLLTFAVRHIAHGVGALFGVLLTVTPGVHWKGRRSAESFKTYGEKTV